MSKSRPTVSHVSGYKDEIINDTFIKNNCFIRQQILLSRFLKLNRKSFNFDVQRLYHFKYA